MSDLSVQDIQELLLPYTTAPIDAKIGEQIQQYLSVFAVWSRRISLSTVKDPSEVVRRHFGEGFALEQALPPYSTLLDIGSGAGFPGLPIALRRGGSGVTLAESQQKKASFLKEVSWTMQVPVSVWAARAEDLPANSPFDVVTLRAVDNMPFALETAAKLLNSNGTLAFFIGERESIAPPLGAWKSVRRVEIPFSTGHAVVLQRDDSQ